MIHTDPSTSNFTGISGVAQGASVLATTPIFPGAALRNLDYQAHALDHSYLPMLLSCPSMRDNGFMINMNFGLPVCSS